MGGNLVFHGCRCGEWRGARRGDGGARCEHSRGHGGHGARARGTAMRTVHERIVGATRAANGFSGWLRFVEDGCACYLATARILRTTWTGETHPDDPSRSENYHSHVRKSP